jgi:YidC/Oxa1 family membrane protein insertase
MLNVIYLVLIAPIKSVLLFVLEHAYNATSSYGLAIILLSIVFNLLLLPAYHLAEKIQKKERDIQRQMAPKVAEFKFAFKSQERYWMMRTLYRQNRYHPIYALRAVLPLAIQIPFFVATFGLLAHYQQLEGVEFIGITDLGRPDRLLFGVNLMPILMTLFNLIAVYLYSRKLDPREAIQSYVVAVVFLVLLYQSPAGLVLYWTVSNVISVIKSWIYTTDRQNTIKRIKECT